MSWLWLNHFAIECTRLRVESFPGRRRSPLYNPPGCTDGPTTQGSGGGEEPEGTEACRPSRIEILRQVLRRECNLCFSRPSPEDGQRLVFWSPPTTGFVSPSESEETVDPAEPPPRETCPGLVCPEPPDIEVPNPVGPLPQGCGIISPCSTRSCMICFATQVSLNACNAL